jgi:flagellar biosynthetic protein FliR
VTAFPPDAQAFGVALLLCARMLPLAWTATRAGLRGVPALPLALTLVLASCLYPSAAVAAATLPSSPLALLALSLRELLIGLVYAFALVLPLAALSWAGRLSGRFAAAPGAADALGNLQAWLGLAAFFALSGQRVVLRVLAHGVTTRPLGRLSALAGTGALALDSVRLFADAFAAALLLALPVSAALLLAELGLALSARAASASFAHPVLLSARAALLLLVLCIAMLLLGALLPEFFRHGLSGAARALGAS